jgi:hypothetical protein
MDKQVVSELGAEPKLSCNEASKAKIANPAKIDRPVRIFSYNGWPTNDLGKDGDFFIDELDNMLYGPKTDGAWPESGVPAVGVCKRNFFGMTAAPLRSTSKPPEGSSLIRGIKAFLRFLLGVRNSPIKV